MLTQDIAAYEQWLAYKDRLEVDLENAKKQIAIFEHEILMQDLVDEKVLSVKTESGKVLRVSNRCFASLKKSLPNEEREACFNWLRENGGADLIKSNVIVSDATVKTAIAIRDFVQDKPVSFEQNIHSATLASFLAELTGNKDGAVASIPEDAIPKPLGFYVDRRAQLFAK